MEEESSLLLFFLIIPRSEAIELLVEEREHFVKEIGARRMNWVAWVDCERRTKNSSLSFWFLSFVYIAFRVVGDFLRGVERKNEGYSCSCGPLPFRNVFVVDSASDKERREIVTETRAKERDRALKREEEKLIRISVRHTPLAQPDVFL